MSLAVVVPTYRSGDARDDTWDDLRVCLAAVAAYARGIEVVVAWDGPCPPDDLPPNPLCRVLHRPEGLTASKAGRWALQQTDADDFVVVSDDVVLCPDTLRLLFEDAAALYEHGHKVGILACRSNVAPGPQNIRTPNGGALGGGLARYDSEASILRVDRVSPFCAFMTRPAHEAIRPTETQWYDDDLACYDLGKAGYSLWVSRAYVHHVGMRSSVGNDDDRAAVMQTMNADALRWIRVNRPDFWQHLQQRSAAVPIDSHQPAAADTRSSQDVVGKRVTRSRPTHRARTKA